MSEFTKGKWKSKAFTVVDEHGIAIARVSNVGWQSNTVQANLRLIAHAPEMYEQLKLYAQNPFLMVKTQESF